jgi:putative ABC transport system permease protein
MPRHWWRTWQLGVKSVLLHPLRSLLTVLGIFVGVSSVIWLLSISEGISIKAQEQIASLGADNIIVRTVRPNSLPSDNNAPVPFGLRWDDYRRLQAIPTVRSALPIREIPRTFYYQHRTVNGRLVGCTPEYAEVTRLQVARGHFIADAEVYHKDNVCVLAHEIARQLFPYEDPIGQAVFMDDANSQTYFTVVGVMRPRASSAGIGGSLAAEDFNFDVYIPVTTLQVRLGDFIVQSSSGTFSAEIVQLSQITLRVDSLQHVEETAQVVENALARFHPTRPEMKDYTVVVPLALLNQARTTRMLFMIFMGLIAAISLIVGGIGIMNIMLATITERTREIGIRRALGAKQSDITRQFLVETVVLSVAGGATGILGGLTCGPVVRGLRWLLERFLRPETLQNLPEVMRSVEPVVIPWSIPLAFGISVGIGIVFGLYPARRAASLDPVEALRHE